MSHPALDPCPVKLGREPKWRHFDVLCHGIKIRGFNQFKKILRHIIPRNKPYYFSEKKFLVLGALKFISPVLGDRCILLQKTYQVHDYCLPRTAKEVTLRSFPNEESSPSIKWWIASSLLVVFVFIVARTLTSAFTLPLLKPNNGTQLPCLYWMVVQNNGLQPLSLLLGDQKSDEGRHNTCYCSIA